MRKIPLTISFTVFFSKGKKDKSKIRPKYKGLCDLNYKPDENNYCYLCKENILDIKRKEIIICSNVYVIETNLMNIMQKWMEFFICEKCYLKYTYNDMISKIDAPYLKK